MRPFSFVLLLSLASCGASDGARRVVTEPRHFNLSEDSHAELGASPEVESELNRVLVEYFGEPDAPRLRLLDEWSRDGFDPNTTPFESARPDLTADGVTSESLAEDNKRFWRRELELVAPGDIDRVGPFRGRRKMSERWREQRELTGDSANDAAEFFTNRYPSLAEAGDLFGVRCARCHGFEGGGNGPMGNRLYPKPRNYRAGTFKYVSTTNSVKPRRADLLRTLIHGLPGTAMPSFRTLGSAELNALVDYVRFLSIRGEIEAWLVDEWTDGGDPPSEVAAEFYAIVWERWREAETDHLAIVAPPGNADPRRWELGRAVFLDSSRGNCVSCHGPEGKGDGPTAWRVEENGKRFALLKDDWGEFILPRNLTEGTFRGGSTREDIYRRMYCGIPGTPMPSVGQSQAADGSPLLSQEESWALVDYVLSLSGRGPFADADLSATSARPMH